LTDKIGGSNRQEKDFNELRWKTTIEAVKRISREYTPSFIFMGLRFDLLRDFATVF
jgi:hypothetical protein